MGCGLETASVQTQGLSDLWGFSEQRRGQASGSFTVNTALKGLEGSTLAGRFRFWRGRSGQRYVFSIYPDVPHGDGMSPRYDEAVVIAAEPLRDGTSRIVAIADTGRCPDLFFDGAMLAQARARGATEIHVHLMAGLASERAAIVADLRPRQ